MKLQRLLSVESWQRLAVALGQKRLETLVWARVAKCARGGSKKGVPPVLFVSFYISSFGNFLFFYRNVILNLRLQISNEDS